MTNKSGMDVDAALNELGMLSAVTDSRRDYRGELRRKESNSTACFHVVTANPKFVVNIGAVQKNGPSTPKLESMKKDQNEVNSTIVEPPELKKAAAERRTLKASNRVHHRYFFRPYSKNKRSKQVSLVKDLHQRSMNGGFQIQLPPPAESTLTQAMASMKIERPQSEAASSSAAASLPADLRPRKGLRAHAR